MAGSVNKAIHRKRKHFQRKRLFNIKLSSTSGLQREVFDRLTTHHFSITFDLRSKLLETSLSHLDFCRFLQSVVSAAKASSCSDVNECKSVSERRPDKTGVQLSFETGDGPMVETYLCAERL